ncbi:MAG: hypothetical protein V1911_02355 [Candidatus Micrarchaeota archaeon]
MAIGFLAKVRQIKEDRKKAVEIIDQTVKTVYEKKEAKLVERFPQHAEEIRKTLGKNRGIDRERDIPGSKNIVISTRNGKTFLVSEKGVKELNVKRIHRKTDSYF